MTQAFREPRPPANEQESQQLQARWLQFFQNPSVQAGLMQAGIGMLQPRQPGVGAGAQVGNAIGAGMQAGGAVAERQEARRDQQREQEFQQAGMLHDVRQQERRAGLEERKVDLAERGMEQDATLTREGMSQQERMQQAGFQHAFSLENLRHQNNRNLLAEQMSAQAPDLGLDSSIWRSIIEQEFADASLSQRDVDPTRILALAGAVNAADNRFKAGGGAVDLPAANELTDELWRQIFTDPQLEGAALAAYGSDALNEARTRVNPQAVETGAETAPSMGGPDVPRERAGMGSSTAVGGPGTPPAPAPPPRSDVTRIGAFANLEPASDEPLVRQPEVTAGEARSLTARLAQEVSETGRSHLWNTLARRLRAEGPNLGGTIWARIERLLAREPTSDEQRSAIATEVVRILTEGR